MSARTWGFKSPLAHPEAFEVAAEDIDHPQPALIGDREPPLNLVNWPELYGGMPVNTLGQASGHRTGTINNTDYTWWSSTCNCQQYGVKATYSSANGDSGWPVWYGNNAIALHASGSSGSSRRAVQVEYLMIYYDVDMRTS